MTITAVVLLCALFLLGLFLGFLVGSSHAAKSQWDYLKRRGVVSDDPEWIGEHLSREWRK